MSNKIEGVPEGWELVGIRRAKKGEYSVQGGTPEAKQWEFDSVSVYPIIRKLPEPLKVEAGKFYKQRDGVVIGPIVKMAGGGMWPWTVEGKRRGDQWNDSGKRCLDGYEHTDLVEEMPAPIKIEEGKYYRQADGKVVGPMHKWDRSTSDQYNWTQKGGGVWNIEGERYSPSMRATGNIVAEVSAPYRQFTSAEEFKPFRDKWLVPKQCSDPKNLCFKVDCYCDRGYDTRNGIIGWKAMFQDFVFEDGTPCGMKVS